MSLTFKIKSQSISNPLEEPEKLNEDALLVKHGDRMVQAVLCDGAGGAGVFCKEWADFLSKSMPDKPETFIDQFENWYHSVCESFHKYITIEKDLSDPVLQSKFYKQGSLSTLLALWIDAELKNYFCVGIGDSCLFHFKNENNWELSAIFPINEMATIDSFPNLLAWGADTTPYPSFDEQQVEVPSIFILVSDSLAKWIVLCLDLLDPLQLEQVGVNASFRESLNTESYRYKKEKLAMQLGHKDISGLLDYLKNIIIDEIVFRNGMIQLLQQGVLEQDDFSLVIIEANVS